jgi:hypothetical protein
MRKADATREQTYEFISAMKQRQSGKLVLQPVAHPVADE